MSDQSFAVGNHFCTIDIEKLRLTEGDYRILLWAYGDGLVADYLDCTIQMHVQDGLFFPYGQKIPPHLRGTMMEDHVWTFDRQDGTA